MSSTSIDIGPEGFAARVRECRLLLGLTQRAVDDAVELALGAKGGSFSGRTNRAEAGQELGAKYVEAMATVFGVRPEWLLFGTGERTPRAHEIPAELRSTDVPDASEKDLELVIQVAAARLGAVAPDTLRRLVEEAVHFRRCARDCLELDFLRRRGELREPPRRQKRRGT